MLQMKLVCAVWRLTGIVIRGKRVIFWNVYFDSRFKTKYFLFQLNIKEIDKIESKTY